MSEGPAGEDPARAFIAALPPLAQERVLQQWFLGAAPSLSTKERVRWLCKFRGLQGLKLHPRLWQRVEFEVYPVPGRTGVQHLQQFAAWLQPRREAVGSLYINARAVTWGLASAEDGVALHSVLSAVEGSTSVGELELDVEWWGGFDEADLIVRGELVRGELIKLPRLQSLRYCGLDLPLHGTLCHLAQLTKLTTYDIDPGMELPTSLKELKLLDAGDPMMDIASCSIPSGVPNLQVLTVSGAEADHGYSKPVLDISGLAALTHLTKLELQWLRTEPQSSLTGSLQELQLLKQLLLDSVNLKPASLKLYSLSALEEVDIRGRCNIADLDLSNLPALKVLEVHGDDMFPVCLESINIEDEPSLQAFTLRYYEVASLPRIVLGAQDDV